MQTIGMRDEQAGRPAFEALMQAISSNTQLSLKV